jgi:MoxR-like ATPase
LKDVTAAVAKVDDVTTLRRGSSNKPAPAATIEEPAPAEEKSAPEDDATTEEPRDDKPATEEPAPAEEKKEEPAPAPVMPEKPHKMFYMTLQAVRANVPVYLAGPAGSGKTTLAKQVAGALALSCNIMSFCAQTSKSDLLGFIDATGHYQSSSFRHTFENGGLFLFDEIDAANPNILTLLNSAIANRECTFPDRPEKPVTASPNFRVIAAANTLGRGGRGDYTGRLQLDAATLDRFAVIECEYDESLERIISGNAQWARRVQSIRAAVAVAGERLLISPRASINGARLLAAGMKQDDVEELVIWRGVNRDVRDRITARITCYIGAAD